MAVPTANATPRPYIGATHVMYQRNGTFTTTCDDEVSVGARYGETEAARALEPQLAMQVSHPSATAQAVARSRPCGDGSAPGFPQEHLVDDFVFDDVLQDLDVHWSVGPRAGLVPAAAGERATIIILSCRYAGLATCPVTKASVALQRRA